METNELPTNATEDEKGLRMLPGWIPNAFTYDRLVTLLDALIDHVSEDETHPLASLMEVIGALIQQYEDAHIPEPS